MQPARDDTGSVMDETADPQDISGPPALEQACYCDEGEICKVCLGSYAGLLVAVAGGDGDGDPYESYRRNERVCSCGHAELCRYCVSESFQTKVLCFLRKPWENAPETIKQLATPLAWLDITGSQN
jgi:hypothetical protein